VPHITITDAIIEISQALKAGTTLLSFLRTLKDVAVRLIDAERASIFLQDSSANELWSLIADGTAIIRLPSNKGIVGEVIATNRVLNIPDTASDSRFFSEIDKKTGYVTRSVLCVPMCNRDGRAVGAIELLNKRSGIFTAQDERFLNIFGIQAGLAVENVEMYEDIQENLAQLKLLFEIQEKINISMEFSQIFEIILSRLLPVIGGDRAIICCQASDGRELYFGYRNDTVLHCWEKKSVRSPDPHFDELLERVASLRAQPGTPTSQPADLMYADLHNGTQYIGYLAVHLTRPADRLFNARSCEYLKIVAAQTVAVVAKKEALDLKKSSEKQALLGSMLSTVVHDMKSPLSGISGYTQLIAMRTNDAEIKKYCTVISNVLEHINTMNGELLTYVRGDAVVLEKSRFSLPALINTVLAVHRETFKVAAIDVTIHSSAELQICADSDRLMRVFNNLFINSAEAIGARGTIDIEINSKSGSAEIKITDSGKGIAPHLLTRVFDPFVSFGKKNGTGLGLSICRTIIEKHGGTVEIQSIEGKGTTFLITLPVEPEEVF
jgi:signal transduction histidine kinase